MNWMVLVGLIAFGLFCLVGKALSRKVVSNQGRFISAIGTKAKKVKSGFTSRLDAVFTWIGDRVEDLTGKDKPEAKKRLVFFIPIFMSLYYMIPAILYMFFHGDKPPQARNYFEAWANEPSLFFAWIPLVILYISFVVGLKRWALSLIGLFILFVLLGTAGLNAYRQTSWWQKEVAEEKIEEEKRVERSRARNEYAIHPIIAKPGVWTEDIPIPEKYDFLARPKADVDVIANGTIRYIDGPGRFVNLRRTHGVRKVERVRYRAIGDADVEIPITFIKQ